MCWHCQYPLKLAIKNKENASKGNWFINTFFKKLLYNDKSCRKNLPTSPQLRATEPKEFKGEFAKLKTLVTEFNALIDRKVWYPHHTFGPFTKEQGGNYSISI